MKQAKFKTSLLAVLMALCILCGAGVAAFAENEDPSGAGVTTSSEEPTTKSEEPVSDKDEDKTAVEEPTSAKEDEPTTKASDKEEPTSDKDEPTSKKDEPATDKDEPTTNPEEPTEPAKEPDFAEDYTGIAFTTYEGVEGWWRVEDGKVKPKATGVYQNEYGWWYVKNGRVDFDFYGVEKNEYGWWRIEKGKVNFKANGIYQNRYGWWKTKNGKVDFSYTGVAKNEYGWWRVEKGKVNFKATGIYQNEYGWWRVEKGKVNFNANGIYQNEKGSWYVKKGKVDFSKTGTVVDGKTSYTVQKGKVQGTTIKVPLVNQLPNYPTGCEAASATMVLKYWGYDINLKKMVAAIPRENLRTVNGKRYGPRITEKFVGDPTATYTSKNPGYGAFAPVVTKSMNTVINNQHGKQKAYNITGTTFTDLLKYIDKGHPVIVWSTYNLKTPNTVNAWYIATSTGPEYFSYPRGTHVCVLVGYDAKNIYLADPYGAKTKTFNRSAFNDKYKLLGRQAVVVE